MSFSRMLTAAAAVLLMGGIAFAAPTAKQTNHLNSNSSVMTKMHHESGTIQSMTDTDLMISHTYKGKTENLAFKIDPNTKRVGNVNTGSRVEVYYKNENGDHVATEIKALRSSKMKM